MKPQSISNFEGEGANDYFALLNKPVMSEDSIKLAASVTPSKLLLVQDWFPTVCAPTLHFPARSMVHHSHQIAFALVTVLPKKTIFITSEFCRTKAQ